MKFLQAVPPPETVTGRPPRAIGVSLGHEEQVFQVLNQSDKSFTSYFPETMWWGKNEDEKKNQRKTIKAFLLKYKYDTYITSASEAKKSVCPRLLRRLQTCSTAC